MDVEEEPLDPRDVERAKAFWAQEDVDQVFKGVFGYLDHLRSALKTNAATDKERVLVLKLLDCLDWCVLSPPAPSQVVQVVIGADDALRGPAMSSPPKANAAITAATSSPATAPPSPAASPPAGREELLPPLTPVQLQYQLHSCSKACLPGLPSTHHSPPPFWGQNPLKVPLLCGFKRLSAVLMAQAGDAAEEQEEVEQTGPDEEEEAAGNILYKAPCGQSLRNQDDVLRYLLATESYDVLQVDFFTFNPAVRVDAPAVAGPKQPEVDLSRGLEPTPVELCVTPGEGQPVDFRYRKDRWPHGCFLSHRGTLFSACCDCADGCSDARSCACIAMTAQGQRYTHQRLTEPVPSGIYECGPWCGCDRARCQNRLVQRGIRVRLQVFQTARCGWGVRCRDDVDAGTFVCVFAGVILRRAQSPSETPPPKLTRADLPSDDEVEVVTEWLAPPVLEGRSNLLESPPPTSPPLHVPVIQRPADVTAAQDREKALAGGSDAPSGDSFELQRKEVTMTTSISEVNGYLAENARGLKRRMNPEDLYMLDARKEGNVSRFFNHSCDPNLFIQHVFTDCHDPEFPVVAFFTSRAVKAGTELTWNYSMDLQGGSLRRKEVSCLCSSDGCQGQFILEEKLCEACGVES